MKIHKLAVFFLIFINLLMGFVLFTPITSYLCSPLEKNEAVNNASVIVVLSAGAYHSGQLDFDTLIRLKKGVELYKRGVAGKIICAGGIHYERVHKSIAELMRDELMFQEIPGEDILIQDETINTYNDITYLIDKFKDRFDFNTAVFVSSVYHTRRVKLILLKKQISAKVVSAFPYQTESVGWVEKPKIFRQVFREYLVLFYFWIKGYI